MTTTVSISQDGELYDSETGEVIEPAIVKPAIEDKKLPALTERILADTERNLRRKARIALKSRYLPVSIYNEEQVITIVRAGEELGLPFMSSLRSISIIEGKISLESSLMRALVFRKIPNSRIDFIECSSEKCIIEMQRPGGKVNTFIFTIEDAKRAGLLKKNNWTKYPISMLIARASAIGCRAIFPDALLGGAVYDPDELESEVQISEYEVEIEKFRSEILALSTSLPEDKRTMCIDQTNDAAFKCNVSMLEKILVRTREIVENFKSNKEESDGQIVVPIGNEVTQITNSQEVSP